MGVSGVNAAAAAAKAAAAAAAAKKARGGGSSSGGSAGSSYRGGSYGGGNSLSVNSQGNYSSRPSSMPVETTGPVPDLNSFLGTDTMYQNQLRGFGKALTDMTADVTRRKGILNSEFTQSDKAMKDQRGLDLAALEEDYASRGVLRSGVYGKAVGDYETEFNKKIADLLRRNQQALGGLDQELLQFKSAQKLQQQSAREAAARRYAENYGV